MPAVKTEGSTRRHVRHFRERGGREELPTVFILEEKGGRGEPSPRGEGKETTRGVRKKGRYSIDERPLKKKRKKKTSLQFI